MTDTLPEPLHTAIWSRRLPRKLDIPDTTLWFNAEVSARRHPDKPFYRYLGRDLTFGEFERQAIAVAGWLQHRGVQPGDRVVLLMQNCPQFAVAFYGALRAQAVVVPVNPMNRVDELGHYITDPQTKAAIVAADLAPAFAQANARLEPAQRCAHLLVTHYADALPPREAAMPMPPAMSEWLYARHALPEGATAWLDALAAAHAPAPYTGKPDDLATLPYTSGTTALPKGCMHTHRTLMPNAIGGNLWSHLSAESVALAVVPMFHITGMMYGVHAALWAACSLVLMPRWDRDMAARLIATFGVTHWTCIPTMVIDLLASPNVASFDLSSLRVLSGGGAAMPHAVAERLQRDFGLTFAEGYGLTETAAPSHGNPIDRAKLQCLGIPIFGVDARVVDPTTLELLPPGEVGEIVIHGPMVFKGYWGHPQATDDAFVTIGGKRFFRSGDLGRMDEEGYFFITDRLKRMINASGFKVWPSEVELMLFKHPAVQEACVIASLDAYRGETVKAVVVLRPEAKGHTTADDIIGWAREHMAAYKVPRLVSFTDALPKSGSGKVMWRLLQDQERAEVS
jgi:fatty-acyl-CoA synthase